MSSALEQLPVELVAHIGSCLTLTDVKRVRLVSTTLAHKASSGHFREAFIHSRIDLSKHRRLDNYLKLISSDSGLVSNIRHITLYHSLYDAFTSHDLLTRGGKLSLKWRTISELQPFLEQIFAAVKASPEIRISTINLDIRGVTWRTDSLRNRISTAIFEKLIAALLKTALPIEALHTTEQDDSKPTPYFSGISANALCLESEAFHWFHNLRSLSLSLSDAMPVTQQLTTYADRFLASFTSLLQACDQVSNLRLHWANAGEWENERPEIAGIRTFFSSVHPTLQPQVARVRGFFNSVHATLAAMPLLQVCALDGIYLTEAALLSFVSDTKVANLELRGVLIHEGTWQPVFDSLLQQRFDNLHLQDLLELVEPTWEQYFIVRFSAEPIAQGCTIFKCTADTAPERLQYALTNNLIMANEYAWQAARGHRYGYVPYADGQVHEACFS